MNDIKAKKNENHLSGIHTTSSCVVTSKHERHNFTNNFFIAQPISVVILGQREQNIANIPLIVTAKQKLKEVTAIKY